MQRTYKTMEEWFKRNGEKLKAVSNNYSKLISSDREDVFVKLMRAEKMFNQIEDVAFVETRNFDHILATFEKNYDTLALHARETGRMVPQTNDIMGFP